MNKYIALIAGLLMAFSAQALTLNLKNTDIHSFIETVSKSTGKNFIIDPSVKGKVNVITQTDIDNEALYALFLSILEVHGYIVVEGEGYAKILPEKESKAGSSPMSLTLTDEIITTTLAVNNVQATQMVPVLRPIMSQHAHLAAYSPSNQLIVTDTAANIARLQDIVNELDRSVDTTFELMPLKNASAEEVAKILKQLIPNDAKNSANPLNIATDSRNNQLILSGAPDVRLKVRMLVMEMDKHETEEGNTHIVYLRYANAMDILPTLQNIAQLRMTSVSKDKKAPAPNNNAEVSIQADESTNAIIITAPTAVARSVKAVIEKLDIRRAQVLIEAVIAEVSASDAKELGVQWIGKGGSGVGVISFANAATNITGLASGLLAGDAATTAASIGNGATVITGSADSNGNGIGVVLSALNSVGDANILSTPSIVTLDNEEASIMVGQEVPFITNTELTANATNPFQNYERKDVGLTLKVKPQINEGDTIKLNIEQIISNVVPTAAAADLVTSKREIKTSVMVANNKMLVLGGLMDDTWRDTQSKVPVLRDIPILGAAFRHNSKEKEKRNLMIFIRPTILTDQAIADSVSAQKYRYIQAAELWKKSAEPRQPETQPAAPIESIQPKPLTQEHIDVPEWMDYGL